MIKKAYSALKFVAAVIIQSAVEDMQEFERQARRVDL